MWGIVEHDAEQDRTNSREPQDLISLPAHARVNSIFCTKTLKPKAFLAKLAKQDKVWKTPELVFKKCVSKRNPFICPPHDRRQQLNSKRQHSHEMIRRKCQDWFLARNAPGTFPTAASAFAGAPVNWISGQHSQSFQAYTGLDPCQESILIPIWCSNWIKISVFLVCWNVINDVFLL